MMILNKCGTIRAYKRSADYCASLQETTSHVMANGIERMHREWKQKNQKSRKYIQKSVALLIAFGLFGTEREHGCRTGLFGLIVSLSYSL